VPPPVPVRPTPSPRPAPPTPPAPGQPAWTKEREKNVADVFRDNNAVVQPEPFAQVPERPRRAGLFVAGAVVILGGLTAGIYFNSGSPEPPGPKTDPPVKVIADPPPPPPIKTDPPVAEPPGTVAKEPPIPGGRSGPATPADPAKNNPPPERPASVTPPVPTITTPAVVTPPKPEPTPPAPAPVVVRGPPSNPAHRSTWTAPEDERVMIWMTAGSFSQGSPLTDPDRSASEIPQRAAQITSGFWLDAYEVTNEAFLKFVRANQDWRRSAADPARRNPDYLRHWVSDTGYAAGAANLPVSNVSWHAARAYCEWANKRLPTEAEWEYAARATFKTAYWWGGVEFDPSKANNGPALWPVDRPETRNLWGFYNMLGNVMEWTEEGWLRGGAFNRRPSSLRLSSRVQVRDRAFANVDYGFRCAR
jgi:formylglycine-generating enzyme required for sulfatase activity